MPTQGVYRHSIFAPGNVALFVALVVALTSSRAIFGEKKIE
jgi:hypothetical protein